MPPPPAVSPPAAAPHAAALRDDTTYYLYTDGSTTPGALPATPAGWMGKSVGRSGAGWAVFDVPEGDADPLIQGSSAVHPKIF